MHEWMLSVLLWLLYTPHVNRKAATTARVYTALITYLIKWHPWLQQYSKAHSAELLIWNNLSLRCEHTVEKAQENVTALVVQRWCVAQVHS